MFVLLLHVIFLSFSLLFLKNQNLGSQIDLDLDNSTLYRKAHYKSEVIIIIIF
jgi:hypothetical protein